MIIIKYYLKELGYYTIFLILLIFITSLLNLLGLSTSITNLLIFIFNVLSFLIFGYRSGKKVNSKGYIAGLKISGLFILLIVIVNIIINKDIFKLTTFIYYIILLITGLFGGMLGINKKGND